MSFGFGLAATVDGLDRRRRSSPAAAGFIGSNLVRALLERGDEVRVLDNFSTGNRANLDGLDVEIVEGELRSYERVHNAVRGREVVYHLGALGSVPRSVQDPLDVERRQRRGHAERPARRARRGRAPRRLLVELVGLRRDARAADAPRTLPPDPISPYGVAKLAAERYCVSFSRVYESFETVVLRYFNVFGPRQSPFSQYAAVVPLFITAIATGEPVTIYGDGEQSRDFTYVENVVDATMRAARRRRRERARSSTSPPARRRASMSVADSIGRILGKPVERTYAPAAPRRHPRLVGRRLRRARRARLPAVRRPRAGPAPHRRGSLACADRIRSGAARDRAAQHGRPGLHVAYLTAGPRRARLRHDARRRDDRRGEESMAFVADALRRDVIRGDAAAAPRDLARCATRARRSGSPADPARTPAHPAHAHGEGRRRRPCRRIARRRRTAADHRAHVPRPRAARATSTRCVTFGFRMLERQLARMTTTLVAVSPEVRDDLVELGGSRRRRSSP